MEGLVLAKPAETGLVEVCFFLGPARSLGCFTVKGEISCANEGLMQGNALDFVYASIQSPLSLWHSTLSETDYLIKLLRLGFKKIGTVPEIGNFLEFQQLDSDVVLQNPVSIDWIFERNFFNCRVNIPNFVPSLQAPALPSVWH